MIEMTALAEYKPLVTINVEGCLNQNMLGELPLDKSVLIKCEDCLAHRLVERHVSGGSLDDKSPIGRFCLKR